MVPHNSHRTLALHLPCLPALPPTRVRRSFWNSRKCSSRNAVDSCPVIAHPRGGEAGRDIAKRSCSSSSLGLAIISWACLPRDASPMLLSSCAGVTILLFLRPTTIARNNNSHLTTCMVVAGNYRREKLASHNASPFKLTLRNHKHPLANYIKHPRRPVLS